MKQQRADTIKWISGQCLIGLPDQLSPKEGGKFDRETTMVEFFAAAKKAAAFADLAIYNMIQGIGEPRRPGEPLPPHINCRATVVPIDEASGSVMASPCVVCNRVFDIRKLDKGNCCPGCAKDSWKGDFKA